MIDSEKGQHHVEIFDRGGKRRVWELKDIDKVTWGRVRDDISQSTVSIGATSRDRQADFLRSLVGATGRYESRVFRGEEPVWEGPLTLPTFHRNGVDLKFRDVGHYLSRTRMAAGYSNAYPNIGYVTTRIHDIIVAEMTRKDLVEVAAGLPSLNVVEYVVDHTTLTDAQTSAVTLENQYTVFEHLDSLAQRSGIDYTVVGRAIHIWDTSKPAMGYLEATLTEADFLGELYVSVYGMELGTSATVTDGLGHAGTFGGVDPYYGLVERLDTAYDENATTTPTTAELTSQAKRNNDGRNPTPLQVRVPDNSGLDLRSRKFSINQLVPGVYIPLRAQINIVPVSQMQKLQTLTVTEDSKGETIQVTLFPASEPDEEEEP